MWSSAWNSRFGRAVALDVGRRRARRSRAGRGRRSAEPVDEGVPGLAVGRDGRDADGAVLVGDVVRLLDDAWRRRAGPGRRTCRRRAPRGRCRRRRRRAWRWWSMSGLSGVDRAVDDEPDRAGLEHERLVVAVAVLGPAVGDELHAPGGLVVVRGLGRVADDEDDGVPAGDREGVLGLVVLDEADELLELLEVEVGLALLRRSGRAVVSRHRAASCRSCPSMSDRRLGGATGTPTAVAQSAQSAARMPAEAGQCVHDPRRASTRSTLASTPLHRPSRRSGCSAPPGGSGWPAAPSRPGSTGSASAA